MWNVSAVLADTVDTADITDVFQRARLQQDVPDFPAGNGPVGDVNQEVVLIARIAAPDRETKVIAYKQQYVPAAISDDGTPVTGGEMFCLVPHPEEVAFVVIVSIAFGRKEECAVVVGWLSAFRGCFAGNIAAGKSKPVLFGPLAQCCDGFSRCGFGQAGGVHTEAGGECFR